MYNYRSFCRSFKKARWPVARKSPYLSKNFQLVRLLVGSEDVPGSNNVPPRIRDSGRLARFARNEDPNIRYAVARNKYANMNILKCLMCDADWVVRMAVAWHPTTTTYMLDYLAEDPVETVREAARRHRNYRPQPQAIQTSLV